MIVLNSGLNQQHLQQDQPCFSAKDANDTGIFCSVCIHWVKEDTNSQISKRKREVAAVGKTLIYSSELLAPDSKWKDWRDSFWAINHLDVHYPTYYMAAWHKTKQSGTKLWSEL